MKNYFTYHNINKNLHTLSKLSKIKIINLNKYQCYPKFYRYLSTSNKTFGLIVYSGKLIIDIYNKKQNETQVLLAEKSRLSIQDIDHDLILTENKYLLNFIPNVNFSLHAKDDSTFQIFNYKYKKFIN